MTAERAAPRWSGWGRAFALAAVMLLAIPAATQASKLHKLAQSTVAFASDGTRYVAWQVHERAPSSSSTRRRGIDARSRHPQHADSKTEKTASQTNQRRRRAGSCSNVLAVATCSTYVAALSVTCPGC